MQEPINKPDISGENIHKKENSAFSRLEEFVPQTVDLLSGAKLKTG